MWSILFNLWCLIPFGYLLRFRYGNGNRITLNKNLWVVVDDGTGSAEDALPLNFVSQGLVDEIEKRLVKKYRLKAH